MTDEEKSPNFAVLYADNHPISPRIAAQLWVAADLLADPNGLTSLEEWLPPIAQRQGSEFGERMRNVVKALRNRLSTPAGPGTIENMAEQVATCRDHQRGQERRRPHRGRSRVVGVDR